MSNPTSRRQLFKAAAAGAAGAIALGHISSDQECIAAPGKKPQFQFGMASYTLRKFKLDETLAITNKVGLKNIAFKSFHMPLESTEAQIKEIAAKTRKAGLNLYGGGVIYMKNEDQVNQAFDYAKAAGMTTIVGVPEPQFLALVDKKVKQYNIKVAIHNHGPEDKMYPSPESIYTKIKSLDKRIGICMDIGHTQRCGIDPGDDVIKFGDRLLDVHIKDVSMAQKDGKTVECGRGIINIPKFIKSLADIQYKDMVSFEYEKDADEPLAGLAESVGYAKGVVAGLYA